MEQTLYRKYRPDTFSELAGQEHIKKLFGNSLSENNFSHAYIFAGPRGTGKTTIARIVAKRLNCLNPSGFEPCNACEQCLAVKNGSHLDVIEMDAASNRGIDDFRAIRDKVAYKPAQGKYKVYIIDEVHMLTNEAFNAILKTLEEPPEHAVFILATTNPEKIPDTILSRCQIIPFRNVTLATIKNHLEKVSLMEGYHIEDEVLVYISKRAKGGMRDAMVLLEQIMRFLPKEHLIDKNDVLEVLGGVDEDRYEDFISLIMKSAVEGIISFSDSLYNNGINFEVFLEGFIEYILESLFKISDTQEKFFYLKIAKKASDLIKEIRYSETPNIMFSVEFIDFANGNSDLMIGKDRSLHSVYDRRYDQRDLSDEDNSDAKELFIEEKETKVQQKDVTDEILNITESVESDDRFSDLLTENSDLYMVLHCLDTREENGELVIQKGYGTPFSNLVLDRKEKILREFLESRNLVLKILDMEIAGTGEYSTQNDENTVQEIPSELSGLYDKVKRLFPESKITLKESENK